MQEPAKVQETDFTEESDADLLTLISWREEDGEAARAAWREFYDRYFKLLAYICMKRFASQIGDQGVNDLVNDTSLRVFDGGTDTFKTDETDPEKLRHLIGAWLSQIALNIFRARLRGEKRLPLVQVEEFEFPIEESPPLSGERAEQCEQLKEVLEDLKPRERDILLARCANYHRSKGKQQFESHVLERLAKDWRITKDNVRQIYSRTMRKVEEQLSQRPAR
ncbi:MAG: sigma-70 family RNA polymerase sigma factor [Pirellulales bacterium]|nr:sigma-70 family RNA polymerase sigma factor [Pirellulales bacterium]